MHRRTAMVHLCTHRHPHQITVYYESLEFRHLFSEPIFMPVTLIYIYMCVCVCVCIHIYIYIYIYIFIYLFIYLYYYPVNNVAMYDWIF